jgi:hypothetical protein
MANAILIPSAGVSTAHLAPTLPLSPLDRIRDTFETAEEQPGVYGHTYFTGKDDTLYPGLREVTVQPGDTMYGVLLRQGFKGREISYRSLVEVAYQLNGMEPNEVLRIGQKIIAPTREFVDSQGAL